MKDSRRLKKRFGSLVPPTSPAELRKWHVVDTIRDAYGLDSFLAIITPTTSNDITPRPELDRFPRVTTFRYAADDQRAEFPAAQGMPSLDEVEGMLEGCRPAGLVYIDPWHTYADSLRVFELGLRFLAPRGWLVCHDAFSRREGTVSDTPPSQIKGTAWSGQTWRAFVDTTRRLPAGSRSFIIDADEGVAVISPAGPLAAPDPHPVLASLDSDAAWAWALDHLDGLIDLVSAERWMTAPREVLGGR